MIDKPQIVVTTAQPAAVIRFTIPRSDMPKVMGPAITEVMAAVDSQGCSPVGPIFAHHFRIEPETFDFEVGVPIRTPITPTGRVVGSEVPAATVARTVYHGPYEGLASAWSEFEKWISASGHTSAENLWECYISGPESGNDATRWKTELNRPLRDA